jgi:hypothetical protein
MPATGQPRPAIILAARSTSPTDQHIVNSRQKHIPGPSFVSPLSFLILYHLPLLPLACCHFPIFGLYLYEMK